MKRIFTLLALITLLTIGAQAQKRNLIANSRFEENYKHWRAEGSVLAATGGDISYDIESVAPISGTKSAKITINRSASSFWDRALCYYLPVTKDAQYQIRFKAKATGTTVPLVYELGQNHNPWNIALAKGDAPARAITVTETVQEFVINGVSNVVGGGTVVGDPNWVFKFNLGNQPNGAIFWIDDISVTKINGNWDGNLIPKGDMEEANTGYNLWFDINVGATPCAAFTFDTDNQITGRSLRINKTTTSTDWKASNIEFSYWQNEGADYEMSCDIKAVNGSTVGQQAFRSFTDPQNASGTTACLLSKHFDVAATDQIYHFTLNKNNSDSSTYRTIDYTSSWKGFTKFTCGLGDDATPVGYDVYLDNINVKEIITLSEIEIDGPANVTTDTTYRIWANPTHADNSVTFGVTNGTGSATIDANGKLHGTTSGTVTVTATSTVDGTKTAQKEVTISVPTKVRQHAVELVKIYPNPASDYITLEGLKSNAKVVITDLRGATVASVKNLTPGQNIDLSNVKPGTYFVKITSNNNAIIKKIIKK